MQLKALILFGSCARGDQQEDSDVDMLAIHDDKIYRIDEYGKLNFSLYSTIFSASCSVISGSVSRRI